LKNEKLKKERKLKGYGISLQKGESRTGFGIEKVETIGELKNTSFQDTRSIKKFWEGREDTTIVSMWGCVSWGE